MLDDDLPPPIDDPGPEPPPRVLPLAGGHTRTIRARRVRWRCEWCSQERETWQYPGPPPRYCAECKQAAQNSLAAGAMRRQRAAARDANPYAHRRTPGRPRQL